MAFSVAKAGVIQLSRDLAIHLARTEVRVNALVLGHIETPQLRALFDRISEEEAALRFRLMPMGRFGTLDELAATAAFLASEEPVLLPAYEQLHKRWIASRSARDAAVPAHAEGSDDRDNHD